MSQNGIRYELTHCTVSVNENELVTSYGICCRKGKDILKSIPDISPNKPAVKKFVDKINKTGLPPEYLEEILEHNLDDMI